MQRGVLIVVIVWCSFFMSIAYASGVYGQEGAEGKAVAEIQLQLRILGYNIDRIDGKYNKSTVKTVKSFQKNQGLTQTGAVDEATYKALFHNKRVTTAEAGMPNGLANRIAAAAMSYRGVPYKFGGTTPRGFDCSGFVWYIFNQQGKNLPRTADVQYKIGRPVFMSELKRGDLVFFTTYEPGASHCGIYLEEGKFIHASSSKGIMISKLSDYYWQPRYLGARRII